MRMLSSVPPVTVAVVVLSGLAAVRPLEAQMLGVPVLQNGFSNPGITVAANYGTAKGVRGFGIAAAWAPVSGRFQVSGGVGGYDPDEDLLGVDCVANPSSPVCGAASTWFTYGGRVAVPLTRLTGNGSFGVAPFAGLGAANGKTVAFMHVPVGVAAGYRRALGATRAISVYGSSFYGWTRLTSDVEGAETVSKGLIRFSGGLDVALTPGFGVTIGYEAGAKPDAGEPGPTGSIFGIGLSYAFRR